MPGKHDELSKGRAPLWVFDFNGNLYIMCYRTLFHEAMGDRDIVGAKYYYQC